MIKSDDGGDFILQQQIDEVIIILDAFFIYIIRCEYTQRGRVAYTQSDTEKLLFPISSVSSTEDFCSACLLAHILIHLVECEARRLRSGSGLTSCLSLRQCHPGKGTSKDMKPQLNVGLSFHSTLSFLFLAAVIE